MCLMPSSEIPQGPTFNTYSMFVSLCINAEKQVNLGGPSHLLYFYKPGVYTQSEWNVQRQLHKMMFERGPTTE